MKMATYFVACGIPVSISQSPMTSSSLQYFALKKPLMQLLLNLLLTEKLVKVW